MEPTDHLVALGIAECVIKRGVKPSNLASSEVHDAIQKLPVAQLCIGDIHHLDRSTEAKDLPRCVASWLRMTPSDRRRHVVAQTGRSWDTGECAREFARALWMRHNGDSKSAMTSMSSDASIAFRRPEDQAWWIVVEGALADLNGNNRPVIRSGPF